MNMKREWFLLATAVCFCLIGSAADLEISARGVQGGSAIVVRADATESERYAAGEFRDWTGRLTGERLKILDDSGPLPPKAIVLGLTRHTQGLVPDAAEATKGLGDEGFRIVAVPPHLVVLGSACRGITYGVYEILETYGGICWFTPWKTHIPETGRLSVPSSLDRTERPVVRIRDQISYSFRFDPDFALRMRINGFHVPFKERHGVSPYRYDGKLPWAHTLPMIIPQKKYAKDHPEYFAVRADGTRWTSGIGYQLCCSNPDVVCIVTEYALARVRACPDIRYFGISQNDGSTGPMQCHCDRCRAIDEKEECGGASTLLLVNAVAEAVEKVRPEVIISTLAYRYTQKPPKTIRPRRNVLPLFCSVDCDFSKPINESRFAGNRRFLEDFSRWGEISEADLFVWDYPMNFVRNLLPFPCFRTMCENIRFYATHGAVGFYQECNYDRYADFLDLKAWLLPRLMWNPYQPEKPLIEKFVRGCYGKAAPFILEYINERESLVRDETVRPLQIEMRGDDPALTPEFTQKAAFLMAKAREVVMDDPEAYRFMNEQSAPSDYLLVTRHPVYNASGSPNPNRASDFERVKARAEMMLSIGSGKPYDYLLKKRDRDYVMNFARMAIPDAAAHDMCIVDDWMLDRNEWGGNKLVEDSDAIGGRATHFWGTARGYFRFYNVELKDRAAYRVSVRAKLAPGAKPNGSPLKLGIYDSRVQKEAGAFRVDASKLSNETFAWQELGDIRPSYWTYLRFDAVEPGVIIDALKLELFAEGSDDSR